MSDWVLLGYLAATYAAALLARYPARTAVTLGRVGYLQSPQVPAVALALFVIAPVFMPLALCFAFFATRPVAAERLASYVGVTRVPSADVHPPQPAPVPS